MFYHTDCSCGDDLELSSNCLAQQTQDESMGDYQEVCWQNDLTQVYIHVDPNRNMYLYYQPDTQVKQY